jgi:hypothetical protein
VKRFLSHGGVWLVLLPILAAALPVLAAEAPPAGAGEVLYNGVRLPAEWPPRYGPPTGEPMPVPYLEHPPAVLPIDVGRQLFIDDFLIEKTDLARTFHRPEEHAANPVIRPDRPWEKAAKAPFAAVFSDGVWYDPADRLFKMWYMCGIFAGTAYATSRDGVRWEKPALDVVEKGSNAVVRMVRDSSTVWLDAGEKDPARRWKMFTAARPEGSRTWRLEVRCSADGVRWSPAVATSPTIGDRTTVFYNPFRRQWVFSLRSSGPRGRQRSYREHPDAIAGAAWTDADKVFWTASDRLDPHNPNEEFKGLSPQLYNLDAAPYESLMLGLFSVWQGPENGVCAQRGIQKRNEVLVGFSRDGFHWHRPDRRPFIGATEQKGTWNWGNIQSAGGGCLVVGDRLYFYHSGRALCDEFWDGAASTGLAVLRRDGFASMDAGPREGTLTTRPVKFAGKHLFVNADADEGELAAEVLGEDGRPLEPFSRANCRAVRADKTLAEVTWTGADDLGAASGKTVRFRFYLRSGSLYAFWVSPERSGASRGYVAAGGPGFTGPTDTVGEAAYTAAASAYTSEVGKP